MKKLLYVALLAVGVIIMIAPPVAAQEEKPFTLHGEVRFRGEYDSNTQDFDDHSDDGALFWPYRVRIAAEGKFTKNVSAWIEFQNASVAGGDIVGFNPTHTGSDFAGVSGNGAELYQGNMTLDQLWSKNFSLRIGRQEIVAGNELLLGDLDFYSGLSHDGGVGTWHIKKVNLMVWYTRPFEGSVTGFADNFLPPDQIGFGSSPSTRHFWCGYATWTWNKDQTFDVYLMDLINRGTGGDMQTFGARYAHDTNRGFFWDVEIAKQAGTTASDFISGTKVDANGQAIEGWFGYALKSGKNTHRFYGRLEQASGDKTSSGGKNEGFQPLFGDFHNRLGRGDWFQMADTTTGLAGGISGGIQGLSAGYNGFYQDRHEFGVAIWKYTLEEDNGAASDKLGSATDIWYGFNYSRNVTFSASLSQLSPDDALTALTGGTDDKVTRLYGQARLRF